MKTVVSIVVTLMLLLSLPCRSESFVVGVENIDYYPVYAYRDGKYVGFAKDLLTDFAQKNGHQLTFKAFPVARLTKTYVSGKLDFKYPDNPNWAQETKADTNIHYSKPVFEYTDGVMVLPENKGKGVAALESLATVRGFTPWDYLDAIKAGDIKKMEVNGLKNLVKMVLHGRADASYFNTVVAKYYLEQTLNQPGAMVFDPDLPHTTGYYRLSSIDHPEVIEQFNDYLDGNADFIKRLKQKYQLN